MLTWLATGGVFIAGGIAPRIAGVLQASQFRRRFEDRGAMTDMARATPTWLVTAPDLGIRGVLVELERLDAATRGS